MMKKARAGFTMIELSLSLVFVGILSIMMVLIISNTVSSYKRGVTLNRVNTVGMDLVDDMRTAVQNSSIGSLTSECIRRFPEANVTERNNCLNNGGYSLVSMTKYANVVLKNGNNLTNVPVYGVFCTGTYSYIWNSGYFDKERTGATVVGANAATFTYRMNGGNTTFSGVDGRPFRLLKIQDDTRAVCRSRAISSDGKKYLTSGIADDNRFDISGYTPLSETPVDLILEDSDNDLAIYDLSVATPAESGTQGNLFYSVSFILGTLEGGVDIKTRGKSCAVPTDMENEFFDYCAINNFSFATQANGGE